MDVSTVGSGKFSVIGGARSGIAVARLLTLHGADVFLSELATADKMQHVAAELDQLNIGYEFGGHTSRVLRADVIVVSPGVPSDAPILNDARSKGCRIVSEVEVASWFCSVPIVAVTGTNGKTTTTALLGRIFEDARRPAMVGGNIGLAFSQIVSQLSEGSTAILEISSFQLDAVESFRPKVSVLLNLTPDHLDRYEHSFEKYSAAKCRIFENQRAGDVLVYNADDACVRKNVDRLAHPTLKRLPFSIREVLAEGAFVDKGHMVTRIEGKRSDIVSTEDISIKGQHNLYNAMAASLAAEIMSISTPSLRATLKNFKGVEHRLEFVRDVQGVAYVNDSKATNVDSVWYALQSFKQPIVLFLGGRDKGNDYSRLTELVKKHVRAIVAIGESADKVVGAFRAIVPVTKAQSMEEAVHMASLLASPGDVVLLSPACASFDWFENYEHRGRVFKQLVASL